MKSALVDVPVLILFFNRPQQLSQVFEQVKKARPSRLFLYQDGARNERDLPGIKACREIVSQIDWECEVERLYQEKNFGVHFAEMGLFESRQVHRIGRRRCARRLLFPILQGDAG